MARAVVAGKAIHGNAEEDAANVRRELINPVESVETFQVVGVSPDDAAIRNVRGRVVVLSGRQPFRILCDRCNDVVKHVVVGPVHLDPFLGPKVKTGVICSE